MPKKPKLKELSFLVYGLGISGKSVIRYFKKNGIKKFEIWDDDKKNLINEHRSKNLKRTLSKVDYIVLSPGISLIKNNNLMKFKKKIITDIDLFYLSGNKSNSIVVTGTNGKSTTCKLILHLLKKNRFRCSLGGNIGNPILDIKSKNDDFIIIEASSFQLSHSKFVNPKFGFFLNFTNDHLDWHGNMNNYLNSKFKIFKLQSKNSFAIINKNLKKKFKKKNFLSKAIIPKNIDYQKIKPKIKNDYLSLTINDENMNFLYTFSRLIKIKDQSFINSMKSFRGLPHRFEIFYKKKNITFINDSKATSFKATSVALASLKNIYWILGGLPKIRDKIELFNLKKNITKCYIIGKNPGFFKNQIKGNLDYSITKNLKSSLFEISKDCKLQKKSNKFILLSPAAASFDQFENFEERGAEFKRLCKIYAKKFV